MGKPLYMKSSDEHFRKLVHFWIALSCMLPQNDDYFIMIFSKVFSRKLSLYDAV